MYSNRVSATTMNEKYVAFLPSRASDFGQDAPHAPPCDTLPVPEPVSASTPSAWSHVTGSGVGVAGTSGFPPPGGAIITGGGITGGTTEGTFSGTWSATAGIIVSTRITSVRSDSAPSSRAGTYASSQVSPE